MRYAIEVKNLVKSFKKDSEKNSIIGKSLDYVLSRERFFAVNNVSFSVKKGELFSLLGLNGAGKTVTLSIIATLMHPDKGKVKVNGIDAIKHPDKIRKCLNVMFAGKLMYPKLTLRENLEFFAQMYGLKGKKLKKRVNDLIKEMELEHKSNTKFEDLSTGMKQRAAFARALINDPEILLLDEPTLGVDFQNLKKMYKQIKSFKGKKTIILTTHYLKEAEQLSDRIALMNEGKIFAIGSMNQLKKKSKNNSQSLEEVFEELMQGELV